MNSKISVFSLQIICRRRQEGGWHFWIFLLYVKNSEPWNSLKLISIMLIVLTLNVELSGFSGFLFSFVHGIFIFSGGCFLLKGPYVVFIVMLVINRLTVEPIPLAVEAHDIFHYRSPWCSTKISFSVGYMFPGSSFSSHFLTWYRMCAGNAF